MRQRILFCAIAILLICLVSYAGDISKGIKDREQVAKIVADDNSAVQSEVAGPVSPRSLEGIKVSKVKVVAGTPLIIGTTDYDVSYNSGSSQVLRVDRNGKIHFTFMERFYTLAAPDNRRAQKYVYINGTTLTSGYLAPKATIATGFGGVDAFSVGDAAGFAVLCGHTGSTPPLAAVDGGAGSASFTKQNIGTKTADDPEVLVDNARQTIWITTTGAFDAAFPSGRGRYAVLKSTDYGSTFVDVDTNLIWSTKTTLPQKGFQIGTLDIPMLVAPNGNLALIVTLRDASYTSASGNTNKSYLPPLGTGVVDSVSRIGYFLSTNSGSSWTWNNIGLTGQTVVVGVGDTIYPLFANFGQFSGSFDGNSKLHVLVNGYSYAPVKWTGPNAPYLATSHQMLYWNSITSQWKRISDKALACPLVTDTTSIYDYTSYSATTRRNGNSYGFCWPTISVDTLSNMVFAAWTQPRVNATKTGFDTLWNGYIHYDIYYTVSQNSGAAWGTATKLAGTEEGLFPYASRNITTAGAVKSAHLVYECDTVGGSQTASATATQQINWYYQKIDLPLTGVDNNTNRPETFTLDQNFPNPFNPATTFRFTLPLASTVKLSIFNILGQEVATVVNNTALAAGEHTYNFDAEYLTSGVYFYRLTADKFTSTKKMMLMK